MTDKSTWLSLGFLAVASLAACTTFILYRPEANPSAQPDMPDAFMEQVSAIFMNKQGRPNMKIVTPQLTHYPKDDRTELMSPQVTLYRKSPTPWLITASHCRATDGIENVYFWDNVIIHHAASNRNPATIIKTATLTVYPNKETANTQDLVTMLQPDTTIKAIGMTADMNSGDIKLLSQTWGEYEANS
jgi:lipopolysaccharide export system protein LptC